MTQSPGAKALTNIIGPIVGHTTDSTAKIWMRGQAATTQTTPIYGAFEVHRPNGGLVQSGTADF